MGQYDSHMVSDVEKVRPSNGILVSRDQNCSRITDGNTNGHVPYQYGISTAIKKWD